MKHLTKYLIALSFVASPVFAQANPQEQLHSALVFEKQGQFDQVIVTIVPLVDSNRLSGYQLGSASIMLGAAYQATGNSVEAQRAFDRALRLLDHDRQHVAEYSAALENYAGLCNEVGQLDAAESMWLKALKLRQGLSDHAATMRSLIDLAGLALSRNNIRQARAYLNGASEERKLATDLIDDDFALLFEMLGWLATAEDRAPDAVKEYQRALELSERIHGLQHWLIGWERMLLGKAYARTGDTVRALANIQRGLSILEHALGTRNPRYFISQIAYSQVLDQIGSHAEAVRLRGAADQARKELYGAQCVGCTISKSAFR
jgi:tetratricopeptide (TPR) repeat protein